MFKKRKARQIIDWNKVKTISDLKVIMALDMAQQGGSFTVRDRNSDAGRLEAASHLVINGN